MPSTRRNSITRDDERLVLIVGAVAGVGAALAGCEPTGHTAIDAVLCAATALFVAWIGATAPWWALVVASGLAAGAAAFGPLWLVLLSWLALGATLWVGATRANQPWLRAAITGVVVQVVFRLDLNDFFTQTALIAAGVLGIIVISGFLRRSGYVRRRILFGAAGVVVLAALSGIGAAAGATQARSAATDGYQRLLDGLDQIDSGDTAAAASTLRDAATQLHSAHDNLDAIYAQPAKLVPVLAQNQSVAADVIGRAADAADAAASTLDLIDLDQLRIVNGRVDIDSLVLLQQPLGELEATVTELSDVLDNADSPWLVGPLQRRLARAGDRADKVSHQAQALHAVAMEGPTLLGTDEPQRYLLAFTNPAEARGTTGLMGNWSELTIDGGKLSITNRGRTNDLENLTQAPNEILLDMPDEYFARYGGYGAGAADSRVSRKYWGNATMTPDMNRVGTVLEQMYEGATGRDLAGVIVMDPAALAALLDLTGPITVPDTDITLNSDNAEQYLLVDQYATPEATREGILEAVTDQTVDALLGAELPPPAEMVAKLGDPSLNGHLNVWAADPAAQHMLEVVGIDGELPPLSPAEGRLALTDGLAVIDNNASANKIDSFLDRTITYSGTYNPDTGAIESTAEITLTNNASTDLPSYIIENKVNLPLAWNRTILSIYSPLNLVEMDSDGTASRVFGDHELGWKVYSTFVDIGPGESVTVTFTLTGQIEPGAYSLVIRPQALPNPDVYTIDVVSDDGSSLVSYEGEILRRSVLDSDGLHAWRPAK